MQDDAVHSRTFEGATIANLGQIRRFFSEVAHGPQADGGGVEELLLALNEAVTNILVHGYGGRPGIVELSVARRGRALHAILRDRAPHFDPATTPRPDPSRPLEARPVGGMGVEMIRAFADEWHYRPLPDGNELILVKRNVFA